MDLCRTVIVAALAVALMQMAARTSYDARAGLRVATTAAGAPA